MTKHSQTILTPLRVLIGVLLLKALAVGAVIFFAGIGLGPDEAQYWTWSQQLDWGYYSKPPGIAWVIGVGCALWGNTEFGVRFGALVISALLSLAVYGLARRARLSEWTAFWAGIVMALSPLGLLASLFATTDAPFVLFWTLGCAELVGAVNEDRAPRFWLLGILVACGALFKWPIYYLWILVLALCGFYPKWRTRGMWLGLAISLLGLLPTLAWNLQHEGATFRHVWSTIVDKNQAPTAAVKKGNFWDFLGAQAVLLSPIWFGLLIAAYVYVIKKWREIQNRGLLLCGGITAVILILHLGMALFRKMQGNWAVYAYPTGIVFFCGVLLENVKSSRRWFKAGLWLALFLAGVLISLPAIQRKGWFSKWPLAFKNNPFKECLGWNALPQVLADAGYDSKKQFLFGDRYQTSSLLSFYNQGQQRAYFLNIHNVRHNQFSFWPSMADEQVGNNGFFAYVVQEKEMANAAYLQSNLLKELSPYFADVQFAGSFPLFEAYGKTVKAVWIFRCLDYNGREPEETFLW